MREHARIDDSPGGSVRAADPARLARAMDAERAAFLRLLTAYQESLGANLPVLCSPELNPPLWELGHVGWFEAHWIERNPQRAAGSDADPDTLPAHPDDLWYDSSRVPHQDRWSLPLPATAQVLAELTAVRDRTLALLRETGRGEPDDKRLYFFRLALFHEAMHREAWTYMAQTLGIAAPLEYRDLRRPHPSLADRQLELPGGEWMLGAGTPGFSFDNELGEHAVNLPAFQIDREPVTWGRYLPFVEAGGYLDSRWWTSEGWDWRQRNGAQQPRHLRRDGSGQSWLCRQFDRWVAVDKGRTAMHLTLHEAQAWCRWAGRRLPREAEWEMACATADDFAWGDVWEWTADPFKPYPGFTAHPYRDYSQPWFGTHQALRGASFATSDCLRHPRYRNFYRADRNDIFAGFRSCPLS